MTGSSLTGSLGGWLSYFDAISIDLADLLLAINNKSRIKHLQKIGECEKRKDRREEE